MNRQSHRSFFQRLLRHSLLLSTALRIWNILHLRQRRGALLNVLLVLVNALMDVFSLAAVVPLILLILDASIVHSNPALQMIYRWGGFSQEAHFLLAVVLLLVVLFIVKNSLGALINFRQARFVYDVSTSLSERQFAAFYARDYQAVAADHSSNPAGNILHIPIEFSVYLLLATIHLLSEFWVFAFILGGVALYNWQALAWLLGILGPAFWLLYALKRRKLQEIGQISERFKPLNLKHLYQGIQAYRDARLYGKERFFLEKYLTVQERLNRNFALFQTLNLLPPRFIEVMAVLGVAVIIVYGLLTGAPEQDTVLLLGIFTAAAYRLMPSLNRMFIALVNIKTFQYTLDILEEAPLSRETDAVSGNRPAEEFSFEKALTFDRVSFAYPEEGAFQLRDISLTIRRGEAVGVMGPSGSGKTTLVNLLLRFLQEQSGRLLVDGRPLTPADTPAWRRLIGYVQQDPFLLDGTIAENIALGVAPGRLDRDRLQQAIQQAGLAELLNELPEGWDTVIGEQGARLSGGQRQRVVIARALYRDAQLLVFDEATSELDEQTAQEVGEAIARLTREGKTVLIIAHRGQILQSCQRIYRLQRGEIVGVNRYSELNVSKIEER